MSEQFRYSDEELELLRNTFRDNEELLKTARKVLFGLEVSETEVSKLRDVMTEKLHALFIKDLLPHITGNEPIGNVFDMWMTISPEDKSPEAVDILVRSRAEILDLVNRALIRLKKCAAQKRTLKEFGILEDIDEQQAQLIARNKFMATVESVLTKFKVFANADKETLQQMKTKQAKDSTK
jgi:hypothetical protein